VFGDTAFLGFRSRQVNSLDPHFRDFHKNKNILRQKGAVNLSIFHFVVLFSTTKWKIDRFTAHCCLEIHCVEVDFGGHKNAYFGVTEVPKIAVSQNLESSALKSLRNKLY